MAAPAVHEFGELTSSSLGVGILPSFNFDIINRLGQLITDQDTQIMQRARANQQAARSVWFLNFQTASAAGQNTAKYQEYLQNITDYRCWASLIWNKTVQANTQIPQDNSQASIAIQNAYLARVAVHHMKMTPWLAVESDINHARTVESDVTQFHLELLKAVLMGFIDVTDGIKDALEGIFQSLTTTVNQSQGSSDTKFMVCQRFELEPNANVIRSFVRVISFSVSSSMREVNNAKRHSRRVSCTISYNEYEAVFNQDLWNTVKSSINQSQIDKAKDFANEATVDMPPV